MKTTYALVFLAIAISLASCGSPADSQAETQAIKATSMSQTVVETKMSSDEVEELVAAIDQRRETIEGIESEGVEISSADLKAKIRQKWDKLHFYTFDGRVVRIKTYPHSSISARTEEFYLKEGELILAVVEDDGEGARGKSTAEIDKLYYFHDGEVIKEVKSDEKVEYGVKDSDGEELLSELKEYLDIYRAHLAK